MRLLVHGSQLLYPANTGGRIRTSKLFERLARDHEITWICLRREHETDEQVALMRACCARVEAFPFRDPEKFTPAFYADLARNLLSPHPYTVARYRHPALRARIAALLAEERFDLLICDFLHPALNVMGLPFSPQVLFQHNVESVIFERHWRTQPHPARRAYLYLQWRKLLRFEGQAARWFDHNIMVSEADRQTMARLYGAENASAIPTGVDADYYRPAAGEGPDNELVFTGAMDWLPNVDGIGWFVREVLPRVRREVAARLVVVGRNPLPEVQALAAANPDVVVTGTVDDVRPYVDRARAYVVPLRIGGGTRMKIFEAMAMAKPVVSTRLGAEGLPVTDGRNIVLADEPEELARQIVALLRDPMRRRQLGSAGRQLVTQHFTWDVVARRFTEICEEVVSRRRGTVSRMKKGVGVG